MQPIDLRASDTDPAVRPDRTVLRRCAVIDVLRGLTILSITAFHFYADTRGGTGRIPGPAVVAELMERDWIAALDLSARALVGMPSYRLDVFLLATGFALMLARREPARTFWRRRARAILPNYWLGTLAAVVVFLLLALVRSVARETGVMQEIAHGSFLARGPYAFEWFDIVRSLSIVGRLETGRTMQVLPPSLWYVILVLQVYLAFPLLRWVLDRVGPAWFLAACTGAMLGGRHLVAAGWTWPGFGATGTLLYFVPFRLFAPALGMVAARWVSTIDSPPPPWTSAVLALPAGAVLLSSVLLGGAVETSGIWGMTGPLLIGLPALWMLASSLRHLRRVSALLTWVGVHSLSLLIVQDLLRMVTGSAIAVWGRLDELTWYLLPVYLAAAVALTPLWQKVPAAAITRWRRLDAGPQAASSTGSG